MMNILQVQNQLRNFSEEQLTQEMQRPSGQTPQFLLLNEIIRRKKMREGFDQEQGRDTTVAQDAMAVAGMPQDAAQQAAGAMAPDTDMQMNTGAVPGMKGGGIVALRSGGPVRKMQQGGIGEVTAPRDEYVVMVPGLTPPQGMRVRAETLEQLGRVAPELMQGGRVMDRASAEALGIPFMNLRPGDAFLVQRAQAMVSPSPAAPPPGGIMVRDGIPYAIHPDASAIPLSEADLRPDGYGPTYDPYTDPMNRAWRGAQPEIAEAPPLMDAPSTSTTLPVMGASGQFGTQQVFADLTAPSPYMPTLNLPGAGGELPQIPFTSRLEEPGRLPDQIAAADRGSTTPGTPFGPQALDDVYTIPNRWGDDAGSYADWGPTPRPAPSMAPPPGSTGMPFVPQESAALQLDDVYTIPNRWGDDAGSYADWGLTPGPIPEAVGDYVRGITGETRGEREARLQTRDERRGADTTTGDFLDIPPDGSLLPPPAGAAEDAPSPAPAPLFAADTVAGAPASGGAPAGGGIAAIAAPTGAGGATSDFEQEILNLLEAREKRAQQDKWLALAQAGMALMASRAPTMGRALGEAGMAGLEPFREGRASAEADRLGLLSTLEDWRMQQAQLAMQQQAMAMRGSGGGGSGGSGGIAELGMSAAMKREVDMLTGQLARLRDDATNPSLPPVTQSRAQEMAGEIEIRLNSLLAGPSINNVSAGIVDRGDISDED